MVRSSTSPKIHMLFLLGWLMLIRWFNIFRCWHLVRDHQTHGQKPPSSGEIPIIIPWYPILVHYSKNLPVVPARCGAEVALGLYYKTFAIYRTCMRRAPARPVRACFVRSCCVVVVVVQEHHLRTTPAQCNAKQTLSSHCTLQSSHPALHTSHLHFTFHSSSHLISSLLICQLSSTYLFLFHRSTAQPFSSHRS